MNNYEFTRMLESGNFEYIGILEGKTVWKNKDKVLWGDNMEMSTNSEIGKDIIKRTGSGTPGKENTKGYQKYFDRSRNLHKDIVKRYQALKETMDGITEEYNDVMNDTGISLSMKEKEKAYFEKCKVAYIKDYEMLKNDAENQLNEIYTEMEKDVNAFYTPNGADIDADTLSLINSGIKLTGAEFDEIANKYASNYTMSRLLSDYATKNEIRTNKSATLYSFMTGNKPGNNAELDIIRRLHDTTRMAINDKDPIRARVRTENYDGIYNGFINDMNNSPVRLANYEMITSQDDAE